MEENDGIDEDGVDQDGLPVSSLWRCALAGGLLGIFEVGLCLTVSNMNLNGDEWLRLSAFTILMGAALATVAGAGLLGVIRRCLGWIPSHRRTLGGGVMLCIAAGLVYADATLYVNLYTWAHWGLGLAAICLVASAALCQPAARRPWLAGLTAVLVLATPAWGALLLGSGQSVRRAASQELASIGRLATLWPATRGDAVSTDCHWPEPVKPPQTGVAKVPILLITIDAWRADLANTYLDRAMPKLATRLKNSLAFTTAYTAATRTNESIYSLLTGRWPHRVELVPAGVDSRDQFRVIDDTYSVKQIHRLPLTDKTPTLSEMLGRSGYRTAAIIPYVFFQRGAGITRGFDWIDDAPYQKGNRDNRGTTSQLLTDGALNWLEETDGPWFMWIHYLDPHTPYDPYAGVPPEAPMFDRYLSELRRVDDQLDRLFQWLEESGQLSDIMVILAADHGEEFRDHGGLFHGTTVYEEQARVPLFFLGPGVGAGKIETPVSLVDIAPTLADLVGVKTDGVMDGRTLFPMLSSVGGQTQASTRPILVSSSRSGRRQGVVWRQSKFIHDPETGLEELYRLDVDPAEKRNVVDEQPELASEARCLLSKAGVIVRQD